MENIERNIKSQKNARQYAKDECEERKLKHEIKTGEQNTDDVFKYVLKAKSRDWRGFEQHVKEERTKTLI
ncbi:hypothetical protein DPMN_109220 [Dreissena polymorpha]|uniref:Uncharacterized protein n=1 Tax=Dreissena polymorpha TaxID=45954 RepID=A0A9D4K9W0_DREPO|nr:hypothetical protein DPMN_109220 [Dreissena polymorpha]